MPEFKVGDILRYRKDSPAYYGFIGKRVKVLHVGRDGPDRVELLDAVTEGRTFPAGHQYKSGGAANFEYAVVHPVELMLS